MQHTQLLLIIFLLLTFLAGMYCTVYLMPISTMKKLKFSILLQPQDFL